MALRTVQLAVFKAGVSSTLEYLASALAANRRFADAEHRRFHRKCRRGNVFADRISAKEVQVLGRPTIALRREPSRAWCTEQIHDTAG